MIPQNSLRAFVDVIAHRGYFLSLDYLKAHACGVGVNSPEPIAVGALHEHDLARDRQRWSEGGVRLV